MVGAGSSRCSVWRGALRHAAHAAIAVVLAVGFSLDAVASIGSAVALVVFTFISIGHLRVRKETGAMAWLLVRAIAATSIVFVTFAVTTLIHEPGTIIVIVAILVASLGIDLWWKRSRDQRGSARQS